jgi:hypothetical protein
MTLTALAQHISSKLSGSSNSSGPVDGEASAAEGQADAPAAAAAASAGAGGSDVAVTALAVRNIVQDVASRKSYGLQDGECCCFFGIGTEHIFRNIWQRCKPMHWVCVLLQLCVCGMPPALRSCDHAKHFVSTAFVVLLIRLACER